ncbi:nucleoside recognition domain-containing protein [Radiobacillus deserti]|uniref:Nucleoside transporter/FeoB GTPase Gate domain-containing protein n=1 Tax=Radiobacillus deserti TaxID=2594883 RepID=A0A516KIM4_9BACI|nr:nucleoside recognition domain-containing protein [Radiobacillus deserti]QDP41244.1 hypothetical protein FN924_14265 [Radiobacillus deserti]
MGQIWKRGLKAGLDLTWTLGKVIFPVTLIVSILEHTPVLQWIIDFLTPFMKLIGLPGEAAVPIVLGNLLNLYAGIGAIVSFEFSVKEVFIMAIMLSFCHNLIIESTVASKVGVKWWIVIGVRIMLAFVSASLIHLFWNGGGEAAQYGFISKGDAVPEGWLAIGVDGLQTAFMGIVQLAVIVIPLMVAMQFFRELGWMESVSKQLTPFTKFLGMNKNTSMTLAAGLTLGLAYGAGLMIQAVKEDGVSRKDMTLALIFLVSCHAVIEDTVVFIPLGIPVLPLLFIRLVTAILLTALIAWIWKKYESSARKEPVHEHHYHSL